mmetsp:Transcript_132994/g.384625  ORF Transcript_132994/g.384625 Transcript_132994/m.384625 type:complete len:215 (-) Transcript_132994:912-1556(-)
MEGALEIVVPCASLDHEPLQGDVWFHRLPQDLEHLPQVDEVLPVGQAAPETFGLQERKEDGRAELQPIPSREVVPRLRSAARLLAIGALHPSGRRDATHSGSWPRSRLLALLRTRLAWERARHLLGVRLRARGGLLHAALAHTLVCTAMATSAGPPRAPPLDLRCAREPAMLRPLDILQGLLEIMRPDINSQEPAPKLPQQGTWGDVHECMEKL